MSSKSVIANRKKKILELYSKKACNVSAVCSAVGISRKTFYDYMNTDAEFKEQIEEDKEAILDNAESILQKKIMGEDTTSLIFFLKTKGKTRGYYEKSERHNTHEMPIFNGIDLDVTKDNGTE